MTPGANLFQDWMMAMANHQGKLDLRLEGVSLKLPYIPQPLEVNGTVSISFHLRDLTDRERDAHIDKEIRALH